MSGIRYIEEEDSPVLIPQSSAPTKAFRKTAKVIPFFVDQVLDTTVLSQAQPVGTSISLNDQTNRSLALANRADFLEMCRPSLWGNEDENEFGEMLRGLIITFEPQNEYHLHLLAQIADVQWQLRRAVRYRGGVFAANSDQRNALGMNLGTEKAFDSNSITRKLTEEQHRLIDLYDKVRKQK